MLALFPLTPQAESDENEEKSACKGTNLSVAEVALPYLISNSRDSRASLALLSVVLSIPAALHLAILQDMHLEGGIGQELLSPTHLRSFLSQ